MAPSYYPDLTWEQRNFTYLLKCKLVESEIQNGITMYKTHYETILPDTIYKVHHILDEHPITSKLWIGVDSSNAAVQTYPTYDLLMQLNDIIDLRYSTPEYGSISVIDVGYEDIFNSNRNFKTYKTTHAYFGTEYKYVSGIGITHGEVWEEYRDGDFNLKGCVIDGVVYGDTTFVK